MSSNNQLINAEGKLTRWPKKHKDRIYSLSYLASKFETGKSYDENEVNEIIKKWHTYQDWASLRRELIGFGYATRDIHGHNYRFSHHMSAH